MRYDPDARSLRPGENMPAPTPHPERCPECRHFSPHTFTAGCGAEIYEPGGNGVARRCQCLARNDDPPIEGTILDQDGTPVPADTGRGYPTTDRRRVR
jgi:hypothetical protein